VLETIDNAVTLPFRDPVTIRPLVKTGKGAYEAEIADEAVPNKEPVNAIAVTVFNAASEPETINFFQFGINIYYGWLSELSDPLPFRAYNILINIRQLELS
jgi:hypothetical protein